jgi:energy-coupling factor transporter ATP-binding protein EcfA2
VTNGSAQPLEKQAKPSTSNLLSIGKRKLPSIIDAYCELLEGTTAPPRWKKWVAAWLIGAAVERRVWVRTMGLPIYPNLFVFLLGKSGGGKSISFNMARQLLKTLGPGRTTASSMTSAYFASQLQANDRNFLNPHSKKAEPYHVANVCTTEMGTLFREADAGMLGMLTDLFDCGEFSEGRRQTENTFHCDRTFCAMLVGGTMTHLFSAFTENHWSDGFMSRVVMVYDTPHERGSLFSKASAPERMNQLYDGIVHDLKQLALSQGQFEFTPEAAKLLDDFFTYKSSGGLQLGGPPVPSHPNLRTYCERRHVQIEKLMMIRALDQGETILTADHFHWAHEMVLDAEAFMEEIFKEGHVGSDMAVINQCLYAMSELYVKQRRHPIPESSLYGFLIKRMDAYKVKSVIETLRAQKKMRLATAIERNQFQIKGNDPYWVPLAARWDDDEG